MLFKKGNVLPNTTPIKYGFAGGTLVQRCEVEYWLAWLAFNYNYSFELQDGHDGITFAWSADHWTLAYKGIDGYNMTWRQSLWNVNFNPAYYASTYEYQRFSICHELFHALGAEHGMRNPAGPYLPAEQLIPVLIAQGYSQRFIDNLTTPIDPDDYIITPFDEFSFMDYPIDCSHTVDGKLCGNSNLVASAQDLHDMGMVLGLNKSHYLSMQDWDRINGSPYSEARDHKIGLCIAQLPTFRKHSARLLNHYTA